MRRLVRWLAAAVLLAVAWISPGFFKSSCASAAAVYWDTNGTLAGCGTSASGNWSGTSWNSDSTGGGGGTISTWSSGYDAVLSAGTDAVGSLAISVTGAPMVHNLTVEEGTVTLAGTGSFILANSASWLTNTSLLVQPNATTATLFTVGGPGNSTYSGILSGGGGLAKVNSGVVTLRGVNTFSGSTSIAGGTLNLACESALQQSTLVAPTSGALVFDPGVTSGIFYLGGLGGSGNLVLQTGGGTPAAITLAIGGNSRNSVYAGVLSGSGSLSKIGYGTLTLTNTNSFTGSTVIGGGTLQLGDGLSGHDGWLSGTSSIANSGALVFNVAAAQSLGLVISGIGSLVKAGSGVLTLTQTNSFSGGVSITAGTLQVGNGTSGHDGVLPDSGGIINNATLLYNLYGSQSYAGVISGTGNLAKAGGGTVTLTGPNSLSGLTTVAGGVLTLAHSAALQASTLVAPTSGSVAFDQGVSGQAFNLGALAGVGNLALQNNAVMPAPIALTVGGNNASTTFTGILSGSGSLAKVGYGTLVLSNGNTFTGGTTISGGTLQLGDGMGNNGSLSATGGIVDNAALVFNPSSPQTYSGAISGAGSLVKAGNSRLTLAGSNTFSGLTTVSGGTLNLAHSAALQGSTLVAPPAGSLVFDSGVSSHAFNIGGLSGTGSIALQDTATTPIALSVGGNNGTAVYSGVLSGSGSLIKAGTGTLALIAANTFTGGTTVSGGVLQLGDRVAGHDGSLWATGSVTNNATLSFNLNGSQTYSGSIGGSGKVLVASGSLTVAPGSSITTSSGNMHVGEAAPATLTLPGGSSVNVGGELDLNYQTTSGGIVSLLSLQGGTLSVTGSTNIGHARMGTSGTSAVVNQGAGLFTASGPMTIGQNGAAQSIYNATGGALAAGRGLTVGAQGNGLLNISGSASVSISGTPALAIGGDLLGTTAGTVNLSGGSLSVLGNLVLGNSGLGTFVYSGGALTLSGSLVASGAGTLVLANAMTASFSGKPTHNSNGTLVIVPQSGSEAVTFQQAPPLTHAILGPWAVLQASGTDSSGDYIGRNSGTSPIRLVPATYVGDFDPDTPNVLVVSMTSSRSIDEDNSAYVVKFAGGTSTTLNAVLYVAGGGVILNGATISSGSNNGLLRFSPLNSMSSVPGMVFAGSGTASTIAASVGTSKGLVKFGPGTLVLSGNNPLAGGVVVTSGVLNVQSYGALGGGGTGNDVLVASGAALEIQGGISLPPVPVGISGTGAGSGGAMRNVSDDNSLAGVVTLNANAQIAIDSGSLTLLAPLQGSYNLTKSGTGTLALPADSSRLFTGTISVLQGSLDVSNSGALGTLGAGARTTIGSGASLVVHGGIDLPALPLSLGGSGVGGAGALRNTLGDNGLAGAVSLSADAQVAVEAGSLSLWGAVSGNHALTKSGSGMLVLDNPANSFGGGLTVAAGTLSVSTVNSVGVPGPLGLAATPVALGTSSGTTTLEYAGDGDTSNRPFSLATGSTAVFQIDYPWATLALSGSVGGGGVLVKTGYGMLTLSGPAGYSGSTRIAQGVLGIDPGGALANTSSITVCPAAMLQLTNSGASNQVPDSASIALQGSSLVFYGNGSSSANGEIVGSLLLGGADNAVSVSCASGSNQPFLRFASFPASHTTGTTVDFSANSALIQFSSTTASFSNGILGGYAYYNSADFASLSGSGSGPYVVQACSNYLPGDLGSLAASGTANLRPSGPQTSLSAAKTFYSLNLVGATGIQMTGSGALTLLSGGLIANTTGNIRAGVLKGSTSGELTVNAVQDIAVSSTVADNGGPTALVKTGPGTLTLSGINTYTGDTFLNQGTVVLMPPANTTYGGSIHGLGGLTKSGTATLTLTGTGDFSGTTTVTGGGLCVNGLLGASSTVNLQSSGFLAGSGTIGGDVTATGGGIALAPGGNILGSVTVTSGTLTVGKAGLGDYLSTTGGLYITGAGALAAASTAATIVGNVTYASSANTSFPCMMSGSGSVLTLAPPDTSTFTLTNTASMSFGGVALDSGTLKISSTAALGDNALSINGGTLDLGGWSQFTINSLAGNGGLITSSSGTTDLVLHSSGGTMNFGGSIQGAAFSLTKNGGGTLVLSGSNAFTGGVTVEDGVLGIGGGAALSGTNSLTIGADGVLAFDGGLATVAGSTVSASRTLAESLPSLAPAPVPEPGTWALLAVLGVGLGLSVPLARRVRASRRRIGA